MKFRYIAAAALITTLSACDGSGAKWYTDSKKGECLSVSREHNYIARVSPGGISFFSILQTQSPYTSGRSIPGCPSDGINFATVPAEISINGTRYPSTMVCLNGMSKFLTYQLGRPGDKGEQSAQEISTEATKSFTSFFGADISLGAETAHFGKGNFADVCKPYILQSAGQEKAPDSKGFLSSLFNRHKKSEPATRAQPVESRQTSIHLKDLQISIDPPSDLPSHSVEGGKVNPVPGAELEALKETQPDAITPQAQAVALKSAQSTYLVYHPGTDISAFTWQKSPLPDKSVNGATVHVLRFTTTSPQTNVTTDVDVEINPDGSAGYATSNDRPAPVTTSASVDPVNAYCTLDNGKNVNVYAANGQDYRYSYLDKNNQSELELTEGLFGVKAFHYETQLGMGKAQYIRFNKKQYDYVLLSLDTGKREFYGIRVYKDGSLISSHACKTRLNLDVSPLTDAAHADSDKMGDFVTN